MDDPARFLKFESAVILTEELHQSLTRHPHALHFILCLLQILLSHLVRDIFPHPVYLDPFINLRAWLVCQPFN